MSLGKPTEMTLRDLLIEKLRKRSINVVPEFSVSMQDLNLIKEVAIYNLDKEMP